MGQLLLQGSTVQVPLLNLLRAIEQQSDDPVYDRQVHRGTGASPAVCGAPTWPNEEHTASEVL
jgi:hypothetical protein